MNQEAQEAVWHQIRIDRPELTNGPALSVFLDDVLALGAPGAAYVVVASVEGGGDPVRGLIQMDCASIGIQELHARLRYSTQLDWGNFYFFATVSAETVHAICNEMSKVEAIAATLMTVRVIDDTEVHVFTPDRAVAKLIMERYGRSDHLAAPLSELNYPS